MKNIWFQISKLILQNRILATALVVLGTVYFGFQIPKLQLSYELAKILPVDNPDFQLYETFKQRYGEDGNVLVLGVETDRLFEKELFGAWYDLSKSIKKIDGIKEVVSCADVYEIVKNDSLKKFDFKPLVRQKPQTQAEIDTLKKQLDRLPIYRGFIFSDDGRSHLMAITFDQKAINSKSRLDIVADIKDKVDTFEKDHKIQVHRSGMPYIRTTFMQTVVSEMQLFLVLAIVVTGLILLAFFRSFNAVFFPLLVVLMGVVWSVGLIAVFGYKITILSGLIPSLITVIGVPNSIFLLNKYHEEYSVTGNQMESLRISIEKIGLTTFMANVTTFIGFGVFAFTGSIFLEEFGKVAALSVMLTFLITLILIPVIFSYLPPPTTRHLKHLDGKRVTAVVNFIDRIVHTRRTVIYSVIIGLVALSIIGITRITAIGYVVDDLPDNSPIYRDLKFFEKHFKGVLPFEVNVDAQRAGRILSPVVLTKIRRMEREFAQYPEFTQPLSLVSAVKFFYQAYRGGDPKYYVLPPINEISRMQQYTTTLGKGGGGRFNSFIDSTQRYTRVSFQMADVGTVRTQELINVLQPKIDSIFNYDADSGAWLPKEERFDARITGNSVVFAKGNEYLQKNLFESTLLAIGLIAIIMWMLFLNPRMIPVATLPSLIPLVITAGIMGFFNIALKPSTILIFSIAFGISSDGTIYFLTRYKDELKNKGVSIKQAVTNTILNTGISMFYTAIILFSGFFIFVASTFKGTQALGILISVTLLIAMISNLILLPAFLLTLDSRFTRKMMDEM